MELIATNVAATGLTALTSGDVIKFGDAGGAASTINLGTSASGFTATGEGTITSSRLLDVGPPMASGYAIQLPLDHEWGVLASEFLRVRAHTATAVNMLCWIGWVE